MRRKRAIVPQPNYYITRRTILLSGEAKKVHGCEGKEGERTTSKIERGGEGDDRTRREMVMVMGVETKPTPLVVKSG